MSIHFLPLKHHLDRRAVELIEAATDGTADELLNTRELAKWLGVSEQWLEIGRSRGWGPKFVKLSPRRVRYLRADVYRFLEKRAHYSTAEYLRKLSPVSLAPVAATPKPRRQRTYLYDDDPPPSAA